MVKNTKLRGRWDVIEEKPFTVLEIAHNEEGLSIAIKQLLENNNEENIHFVLGFVKEKSFENILTLFPKTSTYYFCQAKVPRALDVDILKNTARKFGLDGDSYSSVNSAFEAAKKVADSNEAIYVGGSTFVVAEVL